MKVGIVAILLGFIVTLFTGMNLITNENVVEIGNFIITREDGRYVPFLGIFLIAIGGGICVLSTRKEKSFRNHTSLRKDKTLPIS